MISLTFYNNCLKRVTIQCNVAVKRDTHYRLFVGHEAVYVMLIRLLV